MEHLALEIFDLADGKTSITALGSQYANLPEDASITITDTSEIFESGDVWSHSFTLNISANLHIFGTSGDMHGSRLHDQIDKRRARLWVEGLPLYMGYLRLSDEVEVDEDGNVDVTFESGQHTFDEMIDGAKANQVPMMSDVQIGVALWRKRWTKVRVRMEAWSSYFVSGAVKKDGNEWFQFEQDGEMEGNAVQQYPRMVWPKGEFREMNAGVVDLNFVNTDYPYDEGHPYCNVALCYQKYGYTKKSEDGTSYEDYSSEPEAQRGYEVAPACRLNSAPNFYVIYWLRALMKHLGIYIEENQMMDVQDLRRLFFVNTNCAIEEPDSFRNAPYDERYGLYRFVEGSDLMAEYLDAKQNTDLTKSNFTGKNIVGEGEATYSRGVGAKVTEIAEWSEAEKKEYEEKNHILHNAYATPECFPDINISEVIEALENGFGVRLLFSDDYQRVRIVLLRNIFRSQEVQDIRCDIIGEPTKTENSIRGFRMTYGDTEDTEFYYKGFADKLPHKKPYFVDNSDTHDYSHWNLNTDYSTLIDKVSAFDKTCYVTPNTGNAFVIKVDKDAKRYDDLHPSLFGCADFMDAEDGDCTGEEATVETINVGFKPAIMNDFNFENERDGGEQKQRFALFVDEAMRPRRPDLEDGKDYNDAGVFYDIDKMYRIANEKMKWMYGGIVKPGEFCILSDMFASVTGVSADMYGYIDSGAHGDAADILSMDLDGHICEGIRLYLQDNYEPDDEGMSPVEKKDWGLTLGIMRGSGDDAYVKYEFDPDDKEGNNTWERVAGSTVTVHPDTCDCYGNEWDYDGSTVIVGDDENIAKMQELWPDRNISLVYSSGTTQRNESTYISGAVIRTAKDYYGNPVSLLFATTTGTGSQKTYSGDIDEYANRFNGVPKDQMYAADAGMWNILVEAGSSDGRKETLLELQRRAFLLHDNSPIILDDNGVGSRYGRFSLKLRAEKLNPYFDPTKEESDTNRRYLEITDENLRQRGLCDQFYKEYSFWVRNARIANIPIRMELAQLLAIDKTKQATVGDITGFIRKMQFTVSNKTGLGDVKMEMMYI